jgi:DNA invertase Pin-like site-specific DNA recombinase
MRRPSAKDIGISYTRFSDLLQADGDSESRQMRYFLQFCERHHLRPMKDQFIDRGLSGYKDKHRIKGEFGRLLELAKAKKLPRRAVVIVEAWDRLGRLRPDKQINLISDLLRMGLRIGVCRLDDIFSEEDFGTHKWTTLSVFVQLAYEESRQKSERLAESWQQRKLRARQQGELTTGRLPAWLEYVDGEARIIPKRAAVIKRIFSLAAAGYGHVKIVRTLTREGIPPFGEYKLNHKRKRSQFSGKWTRPYIALILRDRRVIGEYQPTKEPGRQPDGPPIANYFPAVVSPEEFLIARGAQEQRTIKRNVDGSEKKDKLGRTIKTGPRQGKYLNLFTGLLKNADDQEGFILHNKGTKAAPDLVLVNAKGESGRSKCVTFSYAVFEKAVRSCLHEIDAGDIFPEEENPNEIAVLEAELEWVRDKKSALKAELLKGDIAAVADVLRQLETREAELIEKRDTISELALRPLSDSLGDAKKLAHLYPGTIEPEDIPEEDRLRLRAAIRRAVDSLWLLIRREGRACLACLQIWFAGAKEHRDYAIFYRPPRANGITRTEGSWWCKSFAEAELTADLDLRKPKHAAHLAEMLAKLLVEDGTKADHA